MATKKRIRADNTYIISQDSTDNPKLGAKILSNGKESLFLDYYFGYHIVYDEKSDRQVIRKDRKREYLSLYLWHAPQKTSDRQLNKETLTLAKRIRFERGQELLENRKGYRLRKNQDINFLDYFQSYIDNYTKKDIQMLKIALRRFVTFLTVTEGYKQFAKHIKPKQITHDMVVAFTEYLQTKSKGGGAKSIYERFKKVVKYAIEHDVMMKNPCTGVVIKVDEQQLRKDVLSIEEVQQLIATHYANENPTIRRAFIFCLYCGLRYCDVKDLTFANVDYSNKLLKYE